MDFNLTGKLNLKSKMNNNQVVDYLFQDVKKIFKNKNLAQVVNKIVDEKILINDGVDSLLIDTKINANNPIQQSVVDGKITSNNATITASVTSSVTSSINASLPTTIDTRIASTSVKIHNDVQDYTAASIPNGYNLSWNSSTSQWEPTAGAAAKGTVRLFVAEKASNNNVFYFNAITVTALASASPTVDTGFMVTSNLLTKVTIDLRSDINSSNPVRIDLYKNAAGTAMASATVSFANQTRTLTQYNVLRYEFSGLTLNQYDSIHIKVTPTTNPGNLYGIVTIE